MTNKEKQLDGTLRLIEAIEKSGGIDPLDRLMLKGFKGLIMDEVKELIKNKKITVH